MSLTICVYEDSLYSQFHPISHLRPVYLMRSGIFPLYSKIERAFPEANFTFAARDSIAPLVALELRDYPVNIIKREQPEEGEVLFVNGRLREIGDLAEQIAKSRLSTLYKSGSQTVALLLKPESLKKLPALSTPDEYFKQFDSEKNHIPEFECSARLYDYPWELVADLPTSITDDFSILREQLQDAPEANVDGRAILVNPENIIIAADAQVMPGAVIDASHGPVYIGPNSRVDSLAAIYGPTYIGPNSVVVAGKIEACSIGHTCRVGGEVEESIFHSYVNKYHAGFIGHSYVGSWVNFGAMTTNSDLKNNYSNIRVSLNGQMVDTGMMKVGSLIGDHTKFGIGTLLNTGINIGVCCNLFGGNLIADKEVKSFSWGSGGSYDSYKFEKAIATARMSASRRNHTLSEPEERVLQEIHDGKTSDNGILEF